MTLEEELAIRSIRATETGDSRKPIKIGDRVFASGRVAAAAYGVPPSSISRARKNGIWRGLRVEEVDEGEAGEPRDQEGEGK